jgi:hypothetical protein
MSAAGEECSCRMNMDNYIGCAVANADSVSMDINDDGNQTVGCAIARVARADFLSNSNSNDISDGNKSCAETCDPVGLKSDCGGQGSVLLINATGKKNHSSTLAETCNNLLCLSDQLKFWISKFIVRVGNQVIDVSSVAHGPSSTIPIGSTQQHFPYAGTMYQFDPILFHNPDQEFDFDDAEAKLFALMKSPHAIDGCKLVRHRVDKAITCNCKRSWTFICSHRKVMRNINQSHF